MSLRITVEVLPAGGGDAQVLGVIAVDNTRDSHPEGPNEVFRYEVNCTPGPADERHSTRSHHVGHVWHTRSHGWWRLVSQAFALRDRDRT